MVSSTSLSILSSSSSCSRCDTNSTSRYSRPNIVSTNTNTNLKYRTRRRRPIRIIKQESWLEEDDDKGGSPERFLENNSIADYMRFKTGDSPQLQTALVTYRKKFPWSILNPFLQVDLVSTIHIADKQYFATLQKELESYDCVLYEMVASRESLESRRNPSATRKLTNSRSRGFNIIGFIQRQMARVLMLDFQLDCLDYDPDNWYHADLDFETFKLLQVIILSSDPDRKGESLFTFARDMTLRSTKALVQATSIPEELGPWRSKLLWASRVLPMPLVGLFFISSLCADVGDEPTDNPELEALSRLDFGSAMKVFLAKDWTSDFTMVTTDVEEKSVIIGERNRAATEALERAINNGQKKIAILYGGGHMPDLGRRLKDEFDLVPTRVQWVTAWSIKNRNLTSNSLPFLKKLAEVSGWPLNRYQTLALLLFSSVLALDLWFWELFFGSTVNFITQVASDALQFVDNSNLS